MMNRQASGIIGFVCLGSDGGGGGGGGGDGGGGGNGGQVKEHGLLIL